MENRSRFTMTPQFIVGILIIAVGIIFTLDKMNILDARDYLRYWPALLVIYGVGRLAQPRGTSGRFAGFLFTIVGAVLLIDRLYVLDFRLWDLWPLIFVFVGGGIIWRSLNRPRIEIAGQPNDQRADSLDVLHSFAFWGGVRRSISSRNFRGGDITAIMGGCEIDLRGASIGEEKASLDIFTLWGGIVLRVPEDWSIIVTASPLLGGIDDQTHRPKEQTSKQLVIHGSVIMGGVEIKN